MPLDSLLSKFHGMISDLNRKRRRSSNCVDSGPPPKLIKNLQEHRSLRDEPSRPAPAKKSMLGSIFSKMKLHSAEPIDQAEYSDGEDVIVVQKFKRSDLSASRLQPFSNYQFNDKMDPINSKSAANRPLPALIEVKPRGKFCRLPDLHKMAPGRTVQRVNGHQYEQNDVSTRSNLVNGTSLPFRSLSSQPFESSLGMNYLKKSASTVSSKYPTLNTLKPLMNHTEERERYEKLLQSIVPNYGQDVAGDPSSITNRLPTVQNHVSARPPLRTPSTYTLDEEFKRTNKDMQRRFADSSIKTEREVAPINTIRMKLDSLNVSKDSFSDTVKEKYSSVITQRSEIISQHNEINRKLTATRPIHNTSYDSVTHYPRLVIFDEDIEEKIDDFPEFDDNQKQAIRQAMSGSPHAILISKFNIQVSRSHIHTLQWEPLAWLNDEVINFYMSLLTERGELRAGEGYPKVYAMNTFFTQRLFSGGHSAVKRWTKKVDLFACDVIPVPVHVGNVHWCMAIIHMKEKTIKYYDSMGSPNHRVLVELEKYLQQESLDKRKIEFDTSDWSKENVTDNPRQENGSDCGVFSCMTAEFICRNRPIVFSQQHMSYFRQKMVLEICTGKLML